jgi:hypothetical protein
MSELLKSHPNLLPLGITAVSIGAFVTGCIYNKPEISVPGLAIGGVEVLKLITDFFNFIDMRNAVISEAVKVVEGTDLTD